MTDNDEILFKDEIPPLAPAQSADDDGWKILIVDDEEDVHSVTVYMLSGQEYRGRLFNFLHAYSGEEAKIVLAEHPELLQRPTLIRHDPDGDRAIIGRPKQAVPEFLAR